MATVSPSIRYAPTVALPYRPWRGSPPEPLAENLVTERQGMDLQGLDSHCNKPSDFYIPYICSPSKNDELGSIRQPLVLELIHSVTTWNSLTLNDCETLHAIQGHLKVCLEQILQPQLILVRATVLDELQSAEWERFAGANCIEASVIRHCEIEQSHLIQAILKALNARADHQGRKQDNLSQGLLMLYLWSLDYINVGPHPSSERIAIDIRFRSGRTPAATVQPLIQAQVMSYPGYLCFERLNVLLAEGSSLTIKPHYHSNILLDPDGFDLQVNYSIDSKHPWLHWDPCSSSFRGLVPHFSQNPDTQGDLGQVSQRSGHSSHQNVHLLRIDIKAVAVLGYAGTKIRLKRTTRMRVTLRILLPPSPSEQVTVDVPRRCVHVENLVAPIAHEPQNSKDGSGVLVKRAKDDDSGYNSDGARPMSPCFPGQIVRSQCLKPLTPISHSHQIELNAEIFKQSETPVGSTPSVSYSGKYDEEAEELDTRYTPRSFHKRNDACRWLDANVSPKARERGKQSHVLPTPQGLQVAASQTSKEETSPLEPLKFSNRFSVLQNLPDGSSVSSSDTSLGDDKACHLTPPTSESESATSEADSSIGAAPRLIPTRFRSDTQSTGASPASAARIPAPLSPTRADDDHDGGFNLSTRREYDSLKRALTPEGSRQVIEAFRQQGLSYSERRQLANALKLSVCDDKTRSSSLLMRAEEDSDGDQENTQWDGEVSDGEEWEGEMSDEESSCDSQGARLWQG
ncbi:MAG: hypothetical protein Q9204_003090 [Flavoplaca sp. TL-2023a]